ncbi:MAG: DUF2971 domain-containing protein [Nitrospirales bacterium]|nr:DUF2971 domain-containing protein [Nitrospirales bacterium]
MEHVTRPPLSTWNPLLPFGYSYACRLNKMVSSSMTLPPLYKYLDVSGAKLTLKNRTFKHAKPSDFNDLEDLTIQSIFPEDTEEALKRIAGGLTNVILSHLDEEPTCGSPMKEIIMALQQSLRANPGTADIGQTELIDSVPQIYDLEYERDRAREHIAVINEFMQRFRVLCVTIHKDSERMWTEYAEKHKGVCLRIQPNLTKDSKFQLFRPVMYKDKRPPLYEDTLEFIAGAFFGDHKARIKEIVERIIYTKTLDWQHKGEYRLAIPIGEDEPAWNTDPYYPEEITELYLGLEMERSDTEELVEKARNINPDMAIYRANRDSVGKLVFDQV